MRLLQPKGILCPRCEQPLSEHKDGECRKKLSRRSFFGAIFGGAVAAVAVPKLIAAPGETFLAFPSSARWEVVDDEWSPLPMNLPLWDSALWDPALQDTINTIATSIQETRERIIGPPTIRLGYSQWSIPETDPK